MKDVLVGTPYVEIEFSTEMGELTIFQKDKIHSNDLPENLISLNTKRDIGADDCPTFTINLVYKEKWYNQIGGNDLVKIKIGRGNDSKTIMYGLVDSIYKSESYVDLKPIRTLTVQGRGLNKAFLQFGVGAVQEVDLLYDQQGFFMGQDTGLQKGGPADSVKSVIDYFINKGIDLQFANGESLKSLINFIYMKNKNEDETISNVFNYYSYQGGLWDFIKELRNAPFYEIFWEVIDESPTMIIRPTPFNQEQWDSLLTFKLDEREYINDNLGRSDLETYTVFSVKGEYLVSTVTQAFGFPIWYKPFYSKYGLRRLEVNSKYMPRVEIEQLRENSNIKNFDDSESPIVSDGEFGNPVSKIRITSHFGNRNKPKAGASTNHKGIDFGGSMGTPIYSVDGGVVSTVGYNKISGNFIEIQHSNGIVTRYQHLKSKPSLTENTKVTKGQQIGQMGQTGVATGPHLHFEVKINGKQVDPAPYLGIDSKSNFGAKGGNGENDELPNIDWNIVSPNLAANELIQQTKKTGTSLNEKLLKNSENIEEKKLGTLDNIDALGSNKNETTQLENENSSNSVSQKTIDLFNWNIKNNEMENGNITLRGNSKYQVGSKFYIPFTDMEYYIENVGHSFVFGENWTTSLELTRGLKPENRFTKPWGDWSIITADDITEITGIDSSTQLISTAEMGNQITDIDINSGNILGNIITSARSYIGTPYMLKGTTKNGMDCSGLIYSSYNDAGIKIPRFSSSSLANNPSKYGFVEVPYSQKRTGDVMWTSGHLALYVGGNTLIDATTGKYNNSVVERDRANISSYSKYGKVFRYKGLMEVSN